MHYFKDDKNQTFNIFVLKELHYIISTLEIVKENVNNIKIVSMLGHFEFYIKKDLNTGFIFKFRLATVAAQER